MTETTHGPANESDQVALASTNAATVLIVEDERELADLFEMWLSDEYDVRTTYTGMDALDAIDPSVDIVLLDRRLPDIPGDDVLGRIRERELECQVAMVTAVDPDIDLLKLAVDEYVVKPISRGDLVSLVEELTVRKTLEHDLQLFRSLASKKKTLEENKSMGELRANRRYEILRTKLSELHNGLEAQLGHQSSYAMKPWKRYSRVKVVAGIVALFAVAVSLLLAHFLVPDAPDRLFAYGSPRSNALVAYLALFAHISTAHLYGNVGGYLAVSMITYVLCLRMATLRWFYLTTGLLLSVLPLGSMYITYGLFDLIAPEQAPLFVGFSHVVSGFVGFSFLAFLTMLRTVYAPRSVLLVGGYVVTLSTAAILWVHNSNMFVLAGVAGVAALAIFMLDQFGRRADRRDVDRETIVKEFVLISVIGGLYAGIGVGLVPAMELEAFPGTVGHLVGLVGGFGLALGTALFLNVFPIRDRLKEKGYRLPNRLL